MDYKLFNGDCLEVMAGLADESVDAVVTDPPYGLNKEPNITEILINWIAGKPANVKGGGFMCSSWDSFVPGPEYWRQVYRVLKPGAHALVFASPRTMDLMTTALRLAGFEIRDCIRSLHDGQLHSPAWLYAQGFPKSQNISKDIDKLMGVKREVLGEYNGTYGMNDSRVEAGYRDNPVKPGQITAATSDEAKQWDGWGTALAPAWEPVIVARKPISEKSVARNVLKHGVGGLNIEAARVPKAGHDRQDYGVSGDESAPAGVCYGERARVAYKPAEGGRWPKNVIHDGSASVLEEFARYGSSKSRRNEKPVAAASTPGWGTFQTNRGARGHTDEGTISRFYFCAKASRLDRNEGLESLPDLVKMAPMRSANGAGDKNFEGGFQDSIQKNIHETVKPTALMLYLIKLCCPPGGVVLDPFAGSGSTGKAAGIGGFSFIGIEKEKRYFPITCARTAHGYKMRTMKPENNQLDMFES